MPTEDMETKITLIKDGVNFFDRALTQNKGIHDDTRDGCSNHKAKSRVDVKIWGKSSTNPKDHLDSQANKNDDPAAVPGTTTIHLLLMQLLQRTDLCCENMSLNKM